ncbi:hypothetical protein EJ04DRAFT_139654 [Polyplosphaeria fusca]|uniref:Uncharacterized protein n=1 Tax=Polyplosphaeria fusca TaxID=682080 RepID=A0A9P4QHF6_9PLEO|nr:hypothetical protein EJ04DRAFT_139654 [Polyplosphaeria fusca]
MASFPDLPTELRHEVLKHVLTTVFAPPLSPGGIWSLLNLHSPVELGPKLPKYPPHVNVHYPDPPNPRVCFNAARPWGNIYANLLLVSKAFKADTETVSHRLGPSYFPILDVVTQGDMLASWLRPPLPHVRELDYLEVHMRCLEVYHVPGRSYLSIPLPCKGTFRHVLRRLLEHIVGVRREGTLEDARDSATDVNTIRINIVTSSDPSVQTTWRAIHDNTEGEAAVPVQPDPVLIAHRVMSVFNPSFSAELGACLRTVDVCVDGDWYFRRSEPVQGPWPFYTHIQVNEDHSDSLVRSALG